MNTLFNRHYNAFLSYSHKDRDIAVNFHKWLKEDAGFEIWFDENNLQVGSPIAATLTKQMSECRTWIVLASKNSVTSHWVVAERNKALHYATENSDFRLIILRIDDTPLNQVWPELAEYSWLDTPGGVLTPPVAREIINRLDGRVWSGRQTGSRDIYVSHGWRPVDLPFADAVCNGFCARKWRLRLISDAPDQTFFSESRIREILSSCCGHLIILPRRSPSEEDYRYFLRELSISASLGIPALLIAETDTPLPASLGSSACRLVTGEDFFRLWLIEPPTWLERFIEELKELPETMHVFLAAEYKENIQRVINLRELIESVTGLPCQIGRDFEGQELRDQIVSSIGSACLVVANLANFDETTPGNNSVNLNTCVEGGIAMGASSVRCIIGKNPMPVFLTAQSSPEMKGRTAQLPFMFRDSQITWYSNEVELLGHCRRLLRPYRRRIINYEFSKPV